MAEENDGGSGGNVFTRKLGPLPMWAWMGVGLGAALALTSWRGNKKAESDAKSSPQGGLNAPAGNSVPGSLIPQFVNQVYTQSSPPSVSAPAPTPSTPTTPTNVKRTVVNPFFNEVGWDDKAKGSPWTAIVALPGESWKDITARIYQYGDNYASVTDPTNKARIDSVAAYLKSKNSAYTGEVPDGSGPTPGSVVFYR